MFLLCSSVSALEPSYNYDYTIDYYMVDIVVHENNTLDITETITANFNVAKHGIFRTIPLKNKVVRLDGTTSKNRTQLTNLDVDHEYTVSRENGNYNIKIGYPNFTLTGLEIYVIRYPYNLGKDPIKGSDEFYYNIIGSEWDMMISNITFHITMSSEFDSSKLGFSSGMAGSTNNNVKYRVSGNEISRSYDGVLNTNHTLTARMELSEGYFFHADLVFHFKDCIVYFIPILFLLIAILL